MCWMAERGGRHRIDDPRSVARLPALLRPGHVRPRDIADVLGEMPAWRRPRRHRAARFRHAEAHTRRARRVALLPFVALEPLLAERQAGKSAWRWWRAPRVRAVGPDAKACISSPRLKIRMPTHGSCRSAARAGSCERVADSDREAAGYDRMDRGERPARTRGGGLRSAGVGRGSRALSASPD